MKRTLIYILALMLLMPVAVAQKVEMLPYGDFNSWVTRNIKESRVLHIFYVETLNVQI